MYAGPLVRMSSWMFATCGAQPGTEYKPQWRKTPSLASWYHSGTSWVRTESHVGSYMSSLPLVVGSPRLGSSSHNPAAHDACVPLTVGE